MFCPQCKAEYRVGFTKCSDCDVELVDHLLVEPPHDPDAQLVIIRSYPGVLEADLAKNALEGAGIDAVLTTEGGIRRNYFGLDLHGIGLLVRAEDAEDAGKILDGTHS